MKRTIYSPTEEFTLALGARLGAAAEPGTVVSLKGNLGAGKTVLARGVGVGVGVTSRMQSPTYIIVHTHEGGRLPLWHCDLYRLSSADELEHLGLEELVDDDGLVLVEWAERFPELLPADHLEIALVDHNEGRMLTLTAGGLRSERLLGLL